MYWVVLGNEEKKNLFEQNGFREKDGIVRIILRPSLFAPTRLLLLGTYLKKRSSPSPQLVATIATAGQKDVGGEGDEIGGEGEGAGGESGGGGGREGGGHDQNLPSFRFFCLLAVAAQAQLWWIMGEPIHIT